MSWMLMLALSAAAAPSDELEGLAADALELEAQLEEAREGGNDRKIAARDKKYCAAVDALNTVARELDVEQQSLEQLVRTWPILREHEGCMERHGGKGDWKTFHTWASEAGDRKEAAGEAKADEAVALFRSGNMRYSEPCYALGDDSVFACTRRFAKLYGEIVAQRDAAEAAGFIRAAHFQEFRAVSMAEGFSSVGTHKRRYVGLRDLGPDYEVDFRAVPNQIEGDCKQLFDAINLARIIYGSYQDRDKRVPLQLDVLVDAKCEFSEASQRVDTTRTRTRQVTERVGSQEHCWEATVVDMGQEEGCRPASYHTFVRKPAIWDSQNLDYQGLVWDDCKVERFVEAGCQEVDLFAKVDREYTTETTLLEAQTRFRAQGGLVITAPHGQSVYPLHAAIRGGASVDLNDKRAPAYLKNMDNIEIEARQRISSQLSEQLETLFEPELRRFLAFHPLPDAWDWKDRLPRFPLHPLTDAQRAEGLRAALKATETSYAAEEYLLEELTWDSVSAAELVRVPPPPIPAEAKAYWHRVYGEHFALVERMAR